LAASQLASASAASAALVDSKTWGWRRADLSCRVVTTPGQSEILTFRGHFGVQHNLKEQIAKLFDEVIAGGTVLALCELLQRVENLRRTPRGGVLASEP
jgi:hypothetical protein